MAYVIRPYCGTDAEDLSELSLAAIREVGAHAYSAAQIGAWLSRHGGPEMYRSRVAGGSTIFVAADETDTAAAYALIEPDGHLDRLYNHPEHTRQGLATRILIAAEEHARLHGVGTLYTEASELARPAFERAGYHVTHRRDFTIPHNGADVPIHNYAMEKPLS